MNGANTTPALRDIAGGRVFDGPVMEDARLAMLVQSLGRDRVAAMLEMLRVEADPLCAAARGETPFPARFADVEHVHALKGAAASLGAQALSMALAAMERALRIGDVDAVIGARQPLLDAAGATQGAIIANHW